VTDRERERERERERQASADRERSKLSGVEWSEWVGSELMSECVGK
jgi:hypothetical protein